MFSSTTFSVPTRRKNEMIDITGAVFDIVRQRGIKSGICTVFVPHTTAAVTVNENADPDVLRPFGREQPRAREGASHWIIRYRSSRSG